MSSPTLDMLSVYFNEALIDDRPMLRASLYNGGPEGVASARAEFAELLRDRTMTHEEFRQATSVYFATDEEMYSELEAAFRFFFEDQ